jgi:hypothetical protein
MDEIANLLTVAIDGEFPPCNRAVNENGNDAAIG